MHFPELKNKAKQHLYLYCLYACELCVSKSVVMYFAALEPKATKNSHTEGT